MSSGWNDMSVSMVVAENVHHGFRSCFLPLLVKQGAQRCLRRLHGVLQGAGVRLLDS